MRQPLVALVSISLVLTACASSGSSERPVLEQVGSTTRVEGVGGMSEFRTNASDPTSEFVIDATPELLWSTLPLVFAELKVPVTLQVPSERLIGNRTFEVRRQLDGVRLSRYLNCGDQLGNPNADTYQLTLRILTRVLGGGGEPTRLMTVVDGTAKPVVGSGGAVPCTSNGGLEKHIVELTQERLKGAG